MHGARDRTGRRWWTGTRMPCCDAPPPGRPLFCGPLEQMRPPVLLMGSREDPMCRQDLEEEYKAMAAQMPHAAVRLFASGWAPCHSFPGGGG